MLMLFFRRYAMIIIFRYAAAYARLTLPYAITPIATDGQLLRHFACCYADAIKGPLLMPYAADGYAIAAAATSLAYAAVDVIAVDFRLLRGRRRRFLL